MALKLSDVLVVSDDVAIFDETGQWCLFFFHEGTFFYGAINCADPALGYAEMAHHIQRKKRFPRFKIPYYDN